jgi:hypothetical protein
MTKEELKDLKPGDKISILFDVEPWNDVIKREIQQYFDDSNKDYLTFKIVSVFSGNCVLVRESYWPIHYSHVGVYNRPWSYERDY